MQHPERIYLPLPDVFLIHFNLFCYAFAMLSYCCGLCPAIWRSWASIIFFNVSPKQQKFYSRQKGMKNWDLTDVSYTYIVTI
jgi:hypothetical protein